ncbi:unnamed protein product [Cuscuta epithymum]|uniref:DUF1764 domain-containing protein n=1 Tax=Cuscuta epithymum TaxID=186058 RepID=A0AAV0GAE5_9ASTE|nr:unnamed protein product [Cuscuta epithymum]
MPKKNKPKDSKSSAVENLVKEKTLSSSSSTLKKLKRRNEIDEIFAGRKRKTPETAAEAGDAHGKPKKPMIKKKDKKSLDDNRLVSGSRPKKRTGDGFTIYTEEELGINKADAGGTRLCPFDCDCCF